MTSPRFILIVIAAVAPLALTAPIGIKSRFADVVDIASKTYERVRITYARGPSFKSLLSAAACGPVDEQQSHPWSAKQVAFISQGDFAQGAVCGKAMRIKYDGQELFVIIGGQCIGCPPGSVVVSESLFSAFAHPCLGHFFASRAFVEGSQDLTPPYSQVIVAPTGSQKIISHRARRSIEADDFISSTSSSVPVPISSTSVIAKRFHNAEMTWYDVGLGACGWTNKASDFVVAVNKAQYGGGELCGQQVRIRANGKTAIAQVVDECMGCTHDGLDLSHDLFAHFATTDKGVFAASWDFIDGGKDKVEPAHAHHHQRRFDHAQMTWYDVGMGACGWTNKPSDFVVAVNKAQYDAGGHCGQRIEIRANGKTAIAQVVDECMGCTHNGLDLSKGLFAHFAPTDDGVFDASWTFVDHYRRETDDDEYAPRDLISSTAHLSRRFDHAQMTWYDVGMGACGWTNKPSDFVVAINSAQYSSGAHCGQHIEIRANGKSAIAQVVDECPGCSHDGLDLSKSLFAHFAPTDNGVFEASWSFSGHSQRDTGVSGHAARDTLPSITHLSKRFDNAQMTWYDVGLGACGWTNKPSDFVVAINSAQYGSGQHCGRRIEIRAYGKSAIAQVVDECPSCSPNGLDLSKSLFAHFAPTDKGVFDASWSFVGHSQRDAQDDDTSQQLSRPATSNTGFSKRHDNARMTHYEDGLGACGWTNKDSDFVVALNSAQYGSGQHCGQRIRIHANGKSAVAMVVDECPGCSPDGLDLSKGLFSHFAPLDEGIISGSWVFLDDHKHGERDSTIDTNVIVHGTESDGLVVDSPELDGPPAAPLVDVRASDTTIGLAPRSAESGADNVPFTWYRDGLGACGHRNKPSDFIVALSSAQYGSGQYCGRRVEIYANGRSAVAEIVDECPGCGAGGLDLSQGLFDHFAPDREGVIYGSWRFVEGGR